VGSAPISILITRSNPFARLVTVNTTPPTRHQQELRQILELKRIQSSARWLGKKTLSNTARAVVLWDIKKDQQPSC
jgi:hypothetical protein